MYLGCAQMEIRLHSFLVLQSAIALNDTALSRATPSSLLLDTASKRDLNAFWCDVIHCILEKQSPL